jgi:hypothetical protein
MTDEIVKDETIITTAEGLGIMRKITTADGCTEYIFELASTVTDDGPFRKGRKREKSYEDQRWERTVEDNLVSTGKPGRDRIFASQAGLCARQTAGLFFLDPDAEVERKASAQFYFAIGNEVEKVMERAFSKSDLLIDRETRIEAYHEDLPISGRIDFVLKDVYNPENIVLMELKTCGKLPARPKHAHLAQLKTYMILTGMPKGLLWYVSRTVAGWNGDLKQKVFEVTMDKTERWQLAVQIGIGAISGAKGYLPQAQESHKKYMCGFCPLIPFCWEGKDIGMKYKKSTATVEAEILRRATEIADDVLEQQENLMSHFHEAMGVPIIPF